MSPEQRIKDLRQSERDCEYVLLRAVNKIDRQDLQQRLERIRRQIAMLQEGERKPLGGRA